MSQRLLWWIAALTTAIVLSLTFLKKGGNASHSDKVNPAFGAYISAYTSGYISNESPIRIRFASEVAAPAEFDKPVKEDLFQFSPSISGKAYWVDSRTAEFRPEARLPSGTKYTVAFKLSRIQQVPDAFKIFSFSFRTLTQREELKIDGTKTTDRKTLQWQQLKGTLGTADGADALTVEKTFTAMQGGKALPVRWEHSDHRTHKFTVDSIHRTTTPGKMELKWDGEVLGATHSKGTKEVSIPALGDFRVTDVKVNQGTEQYIRIQFSDPIQEKQVLDGLIAVSGTTGLNFTIQDNEIKVYPPARLSGLRKVSVFPGIKNILGYELKERTLTDLDFEELKPEVKLLGSGVILPASGNLLFPFLSVGLNAVDVKIIRIYEKNIAQFLQVNNLDGDREMLRVGKVILKKKVPLSPPAGGDANRWSTYHLDLNELIHAEPGAIYKIVIGFRKAYSTYHCQGGNGKDDQLEEVGTEDDPEAENENWEGMNYYGDGEYEDVAYLDDGSSDQSYSEKRADPCNPLYYGHDREVSRNILASDFGLIAQRGSNGVMNFTVTNLLTTLPEANTVLEVYDYQQQLITTLKTNGEGMASGEVRRKPFLLIAKKGDSRGYLKLDEGSSLSMSAFDVAGDEVQKGIKGFIYGERGVWRPGDTLFLTFLLEDKERKLPANHPVSLELLNPRGQVVKKLIKSVSLNGFYDFILTTDAEAPTGNWMARVKVGGALFTKNLKIETVMPNRLKMDLQLGKELVERVNLKIHTHLPFLTRIVFIHATPKPEYVYGKPFYGYCLY